MRKIMKRMAAIALLIALPALANAQTFEDDYFTYEKVTASSVKIVGFSTKFSEKADPIILDEEGNIRLTRWGAPFTEPIVDDVRMDISTIGELAFSPDNPLYDSWPEGKELCKNIVSVETSWSSLTRIEDKAFMNCENLSSITLGNNTYPHQPMNYVGKLAFAGTKLTRVYWTGDCKTIQDGCFANIPTLTDFDFNSVVTIGEGAFLNASFENLEFPSTLKNIHSKAFDGCSNLKGIKCNDSNPNDIDADAFDGIPDDVLLIVPKGTEDLYKACVGWNVFGDRIQSFTMVGKIVSDKYFTYEIYEDDTEDTAGKCIITGLAPDCTSSMFWGYEIYGSVSVTDESGASHYYSATAIAERAFRNETNIQWMDLSNTSIRNIDSKAFSGCTQMYHLDLPENLEGIGDSAFEGCTKLTKVNLPESVYYLGQRAFAASGLKDICMNTTLGSIGEEVYAECQSLTDVVIPSNIHWIGKGAFSESSIQSVVLCAELNNYIYDFAFADCPNLKKVIALNTNPGDISVNVFKGVAEGAVLFVPLGAYENYYGLPGWTTYLTLKDLYNTEGMTFDNGDFKYEVLHFDPFADISQRSLLLLGVAKGKNPTQVAIPEIVMFDDMDYCVSSIDDAAFQNNGNISLVDLSACTHLTDIGEYTFSGCAKLQNVLLSESVENIYEGAFMQSAIENISFGENLQTIWLHAFHDCNKLKSVNFNCYGLLEIGLEAFKNTISLEKLDLPYCSNLTIYERAFSNSGIKSLYIPYCIDTDLWFGEVFMDCPNLTDVYSDIHEVYPPKALNYTNVFAGVYENATLWVREGLVDTYQALDGWNNFYQIKENIGSPTGIDSLKINEALSHHVYDLQGRRVENARKGIYIVNGKKVVIQ